MKDLSPFDLPHYDNKKYLQYYWGGNVVYNESAMIIKNADGTLDPVKLLYDVEDVVSVRSADLTKLYTENRDYKIENGKLIVLEGGKIPVMDYGQLYFDTKPAIGEIGGIDGNGYFPTVDGKYEKYVEAGILYDYQIAVTYFHRDTGKYTVPPSQPEKFVGFLKKLERGERVRIVCLGDSISNGSSASGFFKKKLPPYMPPYFRMVCEYIQEKYPSCEVKAANYSVGGKDSYWGLTQIDNVAAFLPDLVILGFGMNDGAAYTGEAAYHNNLRSIIEGIRASSPKCEFIVLGTMLPNERICWKEGGISILGNQEKYLEVLHLLSREKNGVAVADITTLHKEYLEVKNYRDMTGNNVNHPNDFFMRLYAQTIVKTIFGQEK